VALVLVAGLVSLLVLFLAQSGVFSRNRKPAGQVSPEAASEAAAQVAPAVELGAPLPSVPPTAPALVAPGRPRYEPAIGADPRRTIPAQWGIEITSVGVAAGGNALDLRYKVLDAAKASSMLFLTNTVYVLDESSGKALVVPFQRENQTSQKLVTGKTYFTLLPNRGDKGERVATGSKVTVILGNSRTEHLVVN
jgi:hypothetical protein